MTLAFVVLVTVAILAFVAHTQSALLAARATVSRMESDNLMTSALESTLSDLRMEMLAGALKDSARTNFDSLDPLVVRRRWAMVPSRLVSTNLPATGFENLVKQSLYRKNFYPGATATTNFISYGPASSVGSRRATAVNTITPSADGRMLSAARWDQVALASQSFPDNALPDWIYVTRGGVPSDGSTLVASNASRSALDNTNYVVGRYAYQIYDVGGLLDLNTAGLPSSSASKAPAKGGVQWADLTAIGFSTNSIKDLMDFRFSATKSYSDLPDRIRYISERAGFLSPMKAGADSDGFFYTRQDLLRFLLRLFGRTNLKSCDPAERQILASVTQDSHFLTSPSWNPPTLGTAERPAILAETKGGNNARSDYDEFNPVIVTNTVLPGKTFNRRVYDNPQNFLGAKDVPAKVGEPFVLNRFPLDRLRLITRTATADTKSDIYRFFGITRASSDEPWVYKHGTVDRILRLNEIQSGNNTDDGKPREPDFLEILKMALSTGALGKSAGLATGGDSSVNADDQRVNYQLIQIFANLVDQFDEDGFPTEVQNEDTVFYGVENLPYLQRIKGFAARLLSDSEPALKDGKPIVRQPYSLVWIPEVWNPHDSRSQFLPSSRPTRFRVIVESRSASQLQCKDAGDSDTDRGHTDFQYVADKHNVELTAAAVDASYDPVTLNTTTYGIPSQPLEEIKRPPKELDDPDWDSPSYGKLDSGLVGIASPVVYADTEAASLKFRYYNGENDASDDESKKNPVDFAMEYFDEGSQKWKRYSRQRNYHAGAWIETGPQRGRSGGVYYKQQNTVRFLWFDPRSERFSIYRLKEAEADANGIAIANAYVDNASLRPDSAAGYGMYYEDGNAERPATGYGWTLGGPSRFSRTGAGTPYAMATIVQNTSGSVTRYTDPDGIVRPGDGYLASGTDPEGQMYWATDASGNRNDASRPIILNRPFRSVAEAGYAFRGTPGRSLDFFSDKSGDSNFLDFFSIDEVPDDAVTSARISANTRNVNVLKSLLRGSLRDPATGATLSNARADEVAQALVNITTDPAKGPLLNRSELVTRFLGVLPVPSGDKLERIKRQREVFIRALADSLETRSWNLLIDLISQTGRVPNGKSLLTDFRVESERHVWVHLSVDRVTGKVLNLNIENVHE